METIVIEVYLPALCRSFDVRVPKGMNTLLCANLTAKALSSLTGGQYQASRSSIFAWRANGALLDTHRSMEKAKVCNGSKLLLI